MKCKEEGKFAFGKQYCKLGGVCIGEEKCNSYKKQLQNNNDKGHNQHTDKALLKKDQPHKYSLLTHDEFKEELKRLTQEKIYHMTYVRSYAAKISFLFEKQGFEIKKSEAEARAEKDFKAKEEMR